MILDGWGEGRHDYSNAIWAQGTPVIALATHEELIPKIVSNIEEVKTRGAQVLCIACDNHRELESVGETIFIPKVCDMLLPSLAVIPLQLFAYYVASLKGCDIDQPRNLAKSVTVE